MSRAFVSEDAQAAHAEVQLSDRPISDRPNLVTRRGLEQIERNIEELEANLAGTAPERAELRESFSRELRYWKARQASAQVVPPPDAPPTEVRFDTVVALRQANGAIKRYRIVGEDEADPERELLSWTSPLAEALMGAEVGEVVDIGGDRPPVEITGIGLS